ncbi:energy coupling factor transporter S component ThiW [Natroniella acetigena]|uniref:energy coupling factor transporter S component ThiW n=1 Tax=Natroniella acetigena TaxID=52004 RepID=UPI003D153FFB
MRTNKLTLAALFVALGTMTSHLVSIPIGVARAFPVQHTINVLSAILLGPTYTVLNAFAISVLRNILGVGSLLAFPGSMIGALLAGVFFTKTHNKIYTLIGEVIGTGIIGAIVVYPVANFILGQKVAALFFVVPFLVSAVVGGLAGYLFIKGLERKLDFK